MNELVELSRRFGSDTKFVIAGGGNTSLKTKDARYALSVTLSGTQFFTLTATPVSGTQQAGDGNISMTSAGARSWNGKSW